MTSPFQTEQMTLAQLFDGSRTFSFPAFQRPYRWGVDEALTLLENECTAQILPDGGHVSRNPQAAADTLIDLARLDVPVDGLVLWPARHRVRPAAHEADDRVAAALEEGLHFAMREGGRTGGAGVVTKVMD